MFCVIDLLVRLVKNGFYFIVTVDQNEELLPCKREIGVSSPIATYERL